MSLITETGEVRRIEDRANTPFFDATGIEESYRVATEIAESAWVRGHVPDDAPYGQKLQDLAVAVAQNCAEAGHAGDRTQPLDLINRSRASSRLAAHLLLVRGLDNEQYVGDLLGVGRDLWSRMLVSERRSAVPHLSGDDVRKANDDQPTEEIEQWLNMSGVFDGGVMRIMRSAAINGYLWGRGDQLSLSRKIKVFGPIGSETIFKDAWIIPGKAEFVTRKPIEDTVFRRTLASAELERERERLIDDALAETLVT